MISINEDCVQIYFGGVEIATKYILTMNHFEYHVDFSAKGETQIFHNGFSKQHYIAEIGTIY